MKELYIIEKSYFDYVNKDAEVMILGITPGPNQAVDVEDAKRLSKKELKRKYAFSGTLMRKNLIDELNYILLNKFLNIKDCKSLWEDDFSRVEMTSLLKNAVYENNESKTPFNETQKINKNKQLKNEFENGFKNDCKKYKNLRIIIALGKKIKIIIDELQKEGIIDSSVKILSIPHPSGGNNGQVSYFLGRSSNEKYNNETMKMFKESKKIIKKLIE